MADILVLLAHPQIRLSRVNAALLRALQPFASESGSQRLGASLEVRDLYARYPDFYVDVAAEQTALSQARLVVWQHPVQWYSMPALMKLWLDEVFSFGWAYGEDGQALRGKWLWPVLSTGGTGDSYSPGGYNQHMFDSFMPPYQQTAALCGMRWMSPLVLHGAHRASDAALQAHAQQYVDKLQTFVQWSQGAGNSEQSVCEVPANARPGQTD